MPAFGVGCSLGDNASGPPGKNTGSDAIDVVASDGSGASASLTWNPVVMAYGKRWPGAMATSSPWRAGASFDVVDADETPPINLAAVLTLPAEPLVVTAPLANAQVSRSADLTVQWTPSDALRVDVTIGEISCAAHDGGSLTIPAALLASQSSLRDVEVMRSRVRRLEVGGQVVHVIVTESLIVPVTAP